jgi:hypothetical protein
VRRLIGYLVVALVAAGCRGATVGSAPGPTEPLRIRESPSPFTVVTAGPVRALIPDSWRPKLAGGASDPERGFIASPHPADWARSRAPVEGMAAVWIDGARIGVPSDYYYLAAMGPAFDLLTHSPECTATRRRVFADHRPTFANGPAGSPGDYVAVGEGRCTVHHTPTRWAYFVAAPGYGPVRRLGIPSSGLYVVVAVLRDSARAPALLNKLLLRTQFGGASVSELIRAARI